MSMQGQPPSADGSSVAQRFRRKPYLAVLPILILFGLLGLLAMLNQRLKRVEAKQDPIATLRASCVAGATNSAGSAGSDANAPEVKARIDRYCTCFVLEIQRQYAPAEFATLSALDGSMMAKDRKFNDLIASCVRQADRR